MSKQNTLSKSTMLILLALGALALVACTPDTLRVGIVPTPTLIPLPTIPPTPTPSAESYLNEAYGFTFDYRSTWTLAEEPHVVTLSQDSLTLRIEYRWATELLGITGRPGGGGGDFIYGGKVRFLGQVIPAQVLEYERQDKAVFYGGNPPSFIEAGDLVFSIWLEDLDGTKYLELDIPQEIQAEVVAILESFELTEAAAQAPSPEPTLPAAAEDGLVTYTDETYGLSFQYPSDWTIQEQGPRYVRLGQGSLSMYIGFMWLYESVDIRPQSGLPAGEFESRGTVTLLGQELSREVLVYAGMDRAVYYNGAGSMIPAGDLMFAIVLEDLSAAESAQVPEDFQVAADQIIESMVLVSVGETLTHSDPTYGFEFYYPVAWSLSEESNAVRLSQDTLSLRIAFKHPSEDISLCGGRTGMPAGEFVDLEPTFLILGGELSKHALVYENRTKIVFYGGTNCDGEEAGGLLLIGWLEDQDPNYDEVDISPAVQADAERILSSFRLAGSGGTPSDLPEGPAGLANYNNDDYGFSFQYPADWTIETYPAENLDEDNLPADADVAPAAAVVLNQDNLDVSIQFVRMSDGPYIHWRFSGVILEPTAMDDYTIMGAEGYRFVFAHEDAIKAIQISIAIPDVDLVLFVTLSESVEIGDVEFDVSQAETIPDWSIGVLDQILSSLAPTQ